MNNSRRLGVWLLATLLTGSLLLLVISTITNQTVGNRQAVKGWLDRSNVYNSVVTAALSSVKDKAGGQNEDGEIPVDKPEIQAVINKALTPEFLKSNTENVIDSMYLWLDGSSPTPQFTVNLAESKLRLIDGLSEYATARTVKLPACKTTAPTKDFDALTATCLPKGVDVSKIGSQVRSELTKNKDFLPDTTLSGADIKTKDDSGKEVSAFQQADIVPKVYQYSGLVPIIFGVIALLLGAAIIFVDQSRRHGVRRVGKVLIINGIFLGLGYLLLNFGSNKAKSSIAANAESKAIKDLVIRLADIVVSDIGKWFIAFAAVFAVLGTLLILASLNRSAKGKPSGGTDDKPAGAEPPKTMGSLHDDDDAPGHDDYLKHMSRAKNEGPLPRPKAPPKVPPKNSPKPPRRIQG